MPLTDFEVRIASEWFRERGVHGACPACNRRQWGLGDIVTNLVRNPAGPETGPEHIPALTMICGACGYIMSFSAKLMGLR